MKQNSLRGAIAAATLVAGLGLAGNASAQPSQAAYALSERFTAAMKRCWFAGGDPIFGNYVAAPEPNATGGPRILVVERGTPDGRPSLVIEIQDVSPKPRVNVYGPLAVGPAADRIGRDLRRWLDGGNGCS